VLETKLETMLDIGSGKAWEIWLDLALDNTLVS
jgi:hypothetical protein